MRHVLIVSPHRPSRELLVRVLAEPGLTARAAADGDEAFDAIAAFPPALVVVDLRRPHEDPPLFLGLLRRRHPHLPVISLFPGCLRVSDGGQERLEDVRTGTPEALAALLGLLREEMRLLLAGRVLRLLRPPVGHA